MTCYVRTFFNGFQRCHQIWKVEENAIFHLCVTNPTRFEAADSEELLVALQLQCPAWFEGENRFEKTVLEPGEYHPRMARPIDQHPNEAPGHCPGADKSLIAIARSQIMGLARQLSRICETIHPEAETLNAYGHDIRNLLILACTEVESQWQGVLTANECRGNFDRRHYVKLRVSMKLDEYAVSFSNYPWLPSFRPFSGWGKSEDSKTDGLTWYDAYNAVKHKRESAFQLATLNNAFHAISACFIMLVAQYGTYDGLRHNPEITSFFHLATVPSWPLSEVYIFPYGEGPQAGYRAKPFSFQFGDRGSNAAYSNRRMRRKFAKARATGANMKIDHDYLKSLLLACQASEKPTFDIEDLNAVGFDHYDKQFEFHMKILSDQHFIEQDDGDPGFGLIKSLDGMSYWSVLPLRLTADGHQFVEALSNHEVWNTIKSGFKDASFETLVGVAKKLLEGYSTKKLKSLLE